VGEIILGAILIIVTAVLAEEGGVAHPIASVLLRRVPRPSFRLGGAFPWPTQPSQRTMLYIF
jgi:hypothetical protein